MVNRLLLLFLALKPHFRTFSQLHPLLTSSPHRSRKNTSNQSFSLPSSCRTTLRRTNDVRRTTSRCGRGKSRNRFRRPPNPQRTAETSLSELIIRFLIPAQERSIHPFGHGPRIIRHHPYIHTSKPECSSPAAISVILSHELSSAAPPSSQSVCPTVGPQRLCEPTHQNLTNITMHQSSSLPQQNIISTPTTVVTFVGCSSFHRSPFVPQRRNSWATTLI